MEGPDIRTSTEVTRWYTKLMENVRLRHRKLLRFSRILGSRFQNAIEFNVDIEAYPNLLTNLQSAGYFLAYIASVEHDGIYILAPPDLLNQPNRIKHILTSWAVQDPSATSDEEAMVPFVLIVCPQKSFVWNGEVVNVDMFEPNLEIKPGRLRLVADGSMSRLAVARQNFLRVANGHVTIVMEQRANFPKVFREQLKMNRIFFRLTTAIIDSVSTIRSKAHGLGCQELVENCFSLATEFGQRMLRYLPPNRQRHVKSALIGLAIQWVAFIADDCIATDRKTFRWAVIAMEYAMHMTNGLNVLVISEEDFNILQEKVGKCMMLLISHFDIMGARSGPRCSPRTREK